MTSKQPRVKLSRLLTLFVIANVALAGLAALFLVFKLAQPTMSALVWHLRHGNKFVLEGHTFVLPLRWNCTLVRYREWNLSEDHPSSHGESSIAINATGTVMDIDAIKRYQSVMFAGVNPAATGLLKTETLHGKRLAFICMAGPNGDLLLCRIPNTDISIIAGASGSGMAETRAILEPATNYSTPPANLHQSSASATPTPSTTVSSARYPVATRQPSRRSSSLDRSPARTVPGSSYAPYAAHR